MALFCSQSAASCLTILCLFLVQSQSAIIYSMRNHHHNFHHHRTAPMFQTNQSGCSLFAGTWVQDDSYPMYQSSECPLIIDPEFNCEMYGRPDSGYLKYRWRPLNCELPRFDGAEFLLKMKGKTVMFVGDSLGKNQWESLVCLIYSANPQTQTQMVKGVPLSTFSFLNHIGKLFEGPFGSIGEDSRIAPTCSLSQKVMSQEMRASFHFNPNGTLLGFGTIMQDYGVTLQFYKAPYLVDVEIYQGKRVLRLEDISENGKAWQNADVLSFNTGHWWSHDGGLQGWDYMESGGKYYKDMDRLAALEKGMKTWANWVDSNIDTARTRVFFLSISPTHFDPNEWNGGATPRTTKNCYGETSPMKASGVTYPGTTYPDQMRVMDSVIRDMKNPPSLLDITMLSELRKDGHPSIYSGELSPQQRANPDRSADCSHWCLPGLPDTWNQLFYTTLLF